MTSLVTNKSSLASSSSNIKPARIPVTIIDATKANSLLDGTPFDETESAQSFQDALKAWRSSGTRNTVEDDEGNNSGNLVATTLKKTFTLADTQVATTATRTETPISPKKHRVTSSSSNSSSTTNTTSGDYLAHINGLFAKPSSSSLSYAEKVDLARLKCPNSSSTFLTSI